MLIVLEGLDGAGKSTQVRRLREYLENTRKDVEYIHFPRYDAPVYGGLISSFLRGDFGSVEEVHPQLVALMFAEDRHGAAAHIREVLSRGGTVLLDRYVYSNIAYQCAKMKDEEGAESLRKWILETEYESFGIPRPDLNIFLDVPISFVSRNLASARQGDDRSYLEGSRDIHEADIHFQEKVKAMYLRQVGEDKDLKVVDCSGESGEMLPPDVIFSRLKAVVDENS